MVASLGGSRRFHMPDWNANIIEEFRTNHGRVGGRFASEGVLLLHTFGRKTGAERVNPTVYLPDGERWVVFGTKGGAPSDPDWIRNLEAHPDVSIEVGAETIPVHATVLRDDLERDELYARQVARYPRFGDYEVKTAGRRVIPVAVLERRGV
jgi:deazaflavin-dependent oxidoreductase (nitroreductase family)